MSALGGMTRGFTRALGGRRLALALTQRTANRRFVFAFVLAAVLSAKIVHIQAHQTALPTSDLVRWFYSFFLQDMAILLLVRLLLDGSLFVPKGRNCLQSTGAIFAGVFIFYVAALNLVGVAFFAVAGSEIHWRNIAVAGDAAGRALLLSGIVYFIFVLCALLAIAWVTQGIAWVVFGSAMDIIEWPWTALRRRLGRDSSLDQELGSYAKVPLEEDEFGVVPSETESHRQSFLLFFRLENRSWGWIAWRLSQLVWVIAVLVQIVSNVLRPDETSLNFMSWTPALLPFIDFGNSSPGLDSLYPIYGSGIGRKWDHQSALDEPVPLTWLPNGTVPMGFEDWYLPDSKHYRASSDPLKISNLNDDLLPMLKEKLKDIKIRHVMVILLESTRKDVFPIKKDGLIWKKFAETFENKKVPADAFERMASLTPTANFLTGDYDDGFDHGNVTKKRGGINFNGATTSVTYTLKSIAATLCGLSPMVADFNQEYEHNIYQPCMPQILGALNTVNHDNAGNYTSYPWSSSFLQSVTLDFDKFDRLIPALGFPKENIIDKEYLKKSTAKFGYVDLPDINYFGMAEVCLEDYIKDAFVQAKEKNERVFMTHITSTSHHPYVMPDDEKYVPLAKGQDDLSHYVNAIGYDDRWLNRILGILEEQGVADETLVVFQGDHGLSIPENEQLACYYNPNIGCSKIPLIISHPQLPAFNIEDSVSTMQVLPTILDLLLETGSLSETSRKAARDLVANYEGQSLIRPMRKVSHDESNPDWKITVMNPGRAMVGVHDTTHRNWRLIIPVIDNIEWRFSDIDADPEEKNQVLSFDFASFLKKVEEKHGLEAAHWAEAAAFVGRWWVEDNSKRWHFGPYED